MWLQIRRRGAEKYEVTGTHDIDKQWVVDVRNAGRERKTKGFDNHSVCIISVKCCFSTS